MILAFKKELSKFCGSTVFIEAYANPLQISNRTIFPFKVPGQLVLNVAMSEVIIEKITLGRSMDFSDWNGKTETIAEFHDEMVDVSRGDYRRTSGAASNGSLGWSIGPHVIPSIRDSCGFHRGFMPSIS